LRDRWTTFASSVGKEREDRERKRRVFERNCDTDEESGRLKFRKMKDFLNFKVNIRVENG